jgi:pilin isopeptide linkage protein/TQXA domain-containing protein
MKHGFTRGACVLWVVMVAAFIALAPPTEAFAAPKPGDVIVVKNGSNLPKQTYGHDVRFHTAPDGSVMYCIEMMVSGGDSTLETKVSSERIGGQVGYVLYHGYPNTRTIAGKSWNATEARFITQCAVWIFTDEGGNTSSTFYTNIKQPYRDAVGSLVRDAKSWASSSKNTTWAPENNYALKCNPTDSSKQRMLLVTGILKGTPKLTKSSGNPTLTSNNSDYSLSGATYRVYKEDGKTDTGTYFLVDSKGKGTLRTWKNGSSPSAGDATASLPAGSYRVKEYRAPKGYALDTRTYTLNVVGLTGGSISVTDTPLEKGTLSLQKSSALPNITESNAFYSLEGAEYGAYSDEACTKPVGTLKTDASGNSNELKVFEGTYWVKEIKPSPGYLLDDVAHKVTVAKNKTAVLKCKEVPATDAVVAVAQKTDADLKASQPQGNASLAGAEFTISYYAGDYDQETLPKTPTRSWVLRTDANGSANLDEEHRVSGDDLYLSADGKPCLPLGTLTISETKAPEGYRIVDDTHEIRRIIYDNKIQGIETRFAPLDISEQVLRGGLKVRKANADGQSLAGARFAVTNSSERQVVVEGMTYAPGEVCLTITSGEDGIAATKADALPYGSYTITETQPPAGYLLNEGWSRTVNVSSDGELLDLTDDPCVDAPLTTSVTLSATKLFDGESQNLQLEEGMFSFTLSDERGTVLQTKSNDAEGNVAFDPIMFEATQAGSHVYTIKEVVGTNELIIYDSHEEHIDVDVKVLDDGSLTAEVTGDEDGAVFRNKTVDELPMPLTGGAGVGMPLSGTSALACAAVMRQHRSRHRRTHA